jgi:hypothetical protein
MSEDSGPTRDVARLHAEWEDVHTQLRRMEQVLSECIELYARGQAARPDHLIIEVERLRTQCTQRFRALMEVLKQCTDVHGRS